MVSTRLMSSADHKILSIIKCSLQISNLCLALSGDSGTKKLLKKVYSQTMHFLISIFIYCK